MKKITPEVVVKIQTFLKEQNIFYGEPSEDWSSHSISALKEYRRRETGKVPVFMPVNVEDLPELLQQYLADKEAADAIEVVGNDSELLDDSAIEETNTSVSDEQTTLTLDAAAEDEGAEEATTPSEDTGVVDHVEDEAEAELSEDAPETSEPQQSTTTQVLTSDDIEIAIKPAVAKVVAVDLSTVKTDAPVDQASSEEVPQEGSDTKE